MADIQGISSTVATYIYDYQTLIAGVIAIVAAYLVARPVWRQLEQTKVQNSQLLREFLQERIRIIDREQKLYSEKSQLILRPILEKIMSEGDEVTLTPIGRSIMNSEPIGSWTD